jgi:glycosyltransferase involved in cell wall biosynthesis|tara:strand:+ start:778 stop:1812 length:1035 start_codon:yes stop_codon:yes gene_type:complete
MANYWADAGHQVQLLIFDKDCSSFYPLSATVQLKALGISSLSYSWREGVLQNITRIKRLREAIIESKPDCILSFLYSTNILVLLATRLLSVPVIISERNNPKYSKEKRLTWFWLRKLFYPFAEHLVVQNQEIKKRFNKYNDSIVAIPNPVNAIGQNYKKPMDVLLPPGKLLVAIGRLVEQKGFDILLNVFSKLHTVHKDWNLVVIGEGHLEGTLRRQTKELNIDKVVYFLGRISHPVSVLSRSDLFVLSSRYEGSPNVLLEAMSCGLPAVSFDCPAGPGEIIDHGINGLLVPPEDMDGLETALNELMKNKQKRNELGKKALEACDRFAMKKIMAQWENIIMQYN